MTEQSIENAHALVRENLRLTELYKKIRNTRKLHNHQVEVFNELTFRALKIKNNILKNLSKN